MACNNFDCCCDDSTEDFKCPTCGQEECFCEPCAGCGKDLATVPVDKLLRCDKCSSATCEDCATIRPVKNDIIDEVLCKICLQDFKAQ